VIDQVSQSVAPTVPPCPDAREYIPLIGAKYLHKSGTSHQQFAAYQTLIFGKILVSINKNQLYEAHAYQSAKSEHLSQRRIILFLELLLQL
jgi:hypothetical protein